MVRENDETLTPAAPDEDSLEEVEDTGRVLALSDGVFAFAMTLLVLNLTIPSAVAFNSPPYAALAMSVAISQYVSSEYGLFSSYILAFLVIGVWWTIHRRVFRHIRGVDAVLNWTNIAFLLFIAVSPFVTGLDGLYGSTGVSVALYSAVQCAAGMTIGLIALHVSGRPELAHPSADRLILERTAETSFMIAGIFSAAATIAQYQPGWSQYAYFAIIIVVLRSGVFSHRIRPTARSAGRSPMSPRCRGAYDAQHLRLNRTMSSSRGDQRARIGTIAVGIPLLRGGAIARVRPAGHAG